jgi:hypothetical protein
VHLIDNSVVQAIGMGSIVVEAILEGKINQIHIKDVFHVSKLYANLFSVSNFLLNGLKVQFNLNEYIVKSSNDEATVIASREQNLYEINFAWKCKKQPTIVLSTTEAEYMATNHCIKETVWLRQFLADVGYVQERPTSIMCVNQ